MNDQEKPKQDAGPSRLVSPNDAATMTTLTAAQLAIMSRKGDFPQPVRISEKRLAYVREEVEAWIDQRIAGRSAR